MSYIYLASPYSHPDEAVRQRRFEEVCRAAGWLMLTGNVVFSPIAHTHPIALMYELPKDWSFWKRQDVGMLRHARSLMVLTLDGWLESKGLQEELKIADQIGLPVFYMGGGEDGWHVAETPR